MTYYILKRNTKLGYEDKGLIKKYRTNEEQRKHLLLEIIELNPKIIHTHLLEISLVYGMSSAKRPYENILNDLEKKNILYSEKVGSSPNAPRLWEIATQKLIDEKQFKENLKISLKEQQKKFNEWEQIIPHLSDYQKALFLSMDLKSNNENLLTAKFGNHVIDLESEIEQLTKYEEKVIKTMVKHSECMQYIPNILRSFQHLTSAAIVSLLEQFTKEKPRS